MGGNALTLKKGSRLSKEQYGEVTDTVLEAIGEAYPEGKVCAIPAYHNKDSYGDLDVLIEGSAEYSPYKLAWQLDASEVVRAGELTSLAYPMPTTEDKNAVFQIDLIRCGSENFEYALNYFSYNDLGQIIGRVANRLGFKHGHLGLSYVLKDPQNSARTISEITVTRCHSDALAFMGYDAVRFSQGFDDLIDVFNYAMSSPYAVPELYLGSECQQSAANKARALKRQTYLEFLDWLDTDYPYLSPNADYAETESVESLMAVRMATVCKVKLREHFLALAFHTFPQFKADREAALERHSVDLALAKVFNGHLVAEATGMEGKELGRHLFNLRSTFLTKEAMLDWMQRASESQIHYFMCTGDRHVL